MAIRIIKADIATLDVDAIVNAANEQLIPGGGVDGAIHDVAGPLLAEECSTLNGCLYGEAKITKGYNLPAKHVIHTVGPVYGQHDGNEADILYSCYYESLRLAENNKVKTIAFPEISTGIYGYPIEEARITANQAVTDYFKDTPSSNIEHVYLVIFNSA